jgi:hypothetical protein
MIAVICLLAMGLASGCSKRRVTAENYDKVKQGMTLSQVRDVLGSDGRQAGTTITMPNGARIDGGPVGGIVYRWEEKGKSISVMFINDKVMTASYSGL